MHGRSWLLDPYLRMILSENRFLSTFRPETGFFGSMRQTKKGGVAAALCNETRRRSVGGAGAGAPHIYAGKQEQPHHIDEMPVPGGEFEAEMLGGREGAVERAQQADDQEDRADDHMRAVEPGRHEEGGAEDVAGK